LLHLPLLEGGGTRAEDSADPLVHGTLLGGTGWAFGPPAFRQGYALSFDGSDDRVVVERALVSPGESFSFSAWIQADARFTGGSIASQLSISTHRPQGWHVYLYPDGSIAPVLYGDAGALDQALPTQVLDGAWHHIAVVFLHDGPRASSALFVDGVFAGATRNVIVGNTQAQAPIVLGALPGGTGFSGLLADIAVYARALHAQEIARQHALCSQTRALLSIPTQSQIVHPKRPALPSPNVLARSSSRLGGGRHGHRSDMVLASVQFVLAQHSGTTVQQKNDPRLCALRRTLGVRPEPDVAALVAKRISMQLHTSQEGVLAALRDPMQCTPQRAVDVPVPPIPFPIDKEGLPVSIEKGSALPSILTMMQMAFLLQSCSMIS
jgi:hypothetical protein